MAVPRIKICGIQTYDEAQMCLQYGVDSLGFLLALTHKAEDEISVSKAVDIIRKLPHNTNTVMVTHSQDSNEIMDIALETKVSAIQIHNDLPVNDIKVIRQEMPEITLLKSVHIPSQVESEQERLCIVESARGLSEVVDGLLLDSRTVDRLGGTGLIHDWETSRKNCHVH